MYNDLFSPIHSLLEKAIDEKIFPGAAVGIVQNKIQNKKDIFCAGHSDYLKTTIVNNYTFYDLASLTKPLATTLSVLSLIKNKIFDLTYTISSMLECEIDLKKRYITLFNLLNHSSGLKPYQDFYKKLSLYNKKDRKKIILNLISDSELMYGVGEKQVYSDIGFILLGIIVELKTNTSLKRYVEEIIFKPLGVEKKIFFLPVVSLNNNQFAPTEYCPWRKRLICGEVHDENSFSLGGISGHAGLFGNILGVTDIVSFLLDVIKGRKEHPSINTEDLLKAVTRQSDLGTWGLGFDTPSREGSSSGSYFSGTSFGHLGFTGTSFWVDPEKDIAIILLTNRVHPERNNNKIKEFRPLFHNTVMELINK